MRKIIDFHIPKSKKDKIIYQVDHSAFYPYYHRHDEIQISLILKDCNYIIADQIGSLSHGEILVIGSNIPHLFQEEESPLKKEELMYSIFIPAVEIEEPLYQLSEFEFLKTLVKQSHTPFIISNHKELYQSFKILFQKTDPLRFIESLGLLFQLTKATKQNVPISNRPKMNEKEGKRLNQIISFMMDQIERDISLEEIASVAHLSPTSFCRFFKQHTGQTFQDFFRRLKMQKAAQDLLNSPDSSINSIALGLGYFNQSSFNRNFKNVYKMSPSKYRKSKT
ncbi:MAG: AraC family transcriptional regulator [Flavobacteriaceae bacterium]